MIFVYVLIAPIAILSLSCLLSPLYFKFGWFKFFYHDLLEWHRPVDNEVFDGVNFHSVCKYCGKDIIQDSQGNWF